MLRITESTSRTNQTSKHRNREKKIRMVVPVQYLVVAQLAILLFSPGLNRLALAAVPPQANPGCQEKCGEINIPYPFGIGRNSSNKSCYLDKWFEIDCNTNSSTSPRPFLKRANLELLEITIPNGSNEVGQVLVNSPIFSAACNGSSQIAGQVVNLTGSNFIFSQIRDSFVGVGCNSRALMANIEPALIGCSSTCGRDGNSTCCENAIPSFLNIFNVSFESIGVADTRGEECKYAFIADTSWLELQQASGKSCVSRIQDLEYVPAWLNWGISDHSIPGISSSRDSDSIPLISFSFTVYYYVVLSDKRKTIQVYCLPGYEGNPYLGNGCQDINECENPNTTCSGTCENTLGSYKCTSKRTQINMVIIGLSSGLGLLIAVAGAWGSCKVIKRRNEIKRKKQFFKRNGGLLLEQQLSSKQGSVEKTNVFSSKELETATDGFNKNRILGHGGQGTVYKGMLPDGRIVAVKKSIIEKDGALIEQFINEVVILSQINHRNIVKLLGCCLETQVPLLVYEFVPNGTLSQYLLHGQVDEFPVSWKMRLQIATEVAGALSYLHSTASTPIYHRDIKSSNILLDEKYRAKVADFGTSRSVSIDQTHLTTLVHGTFGYLDPEYFQSSQFTDKSDVYSFGVVLVELLTGQKAISSLRSEEGRSLATYFITTMAENRLYNILDTRVVMQGEENEIMAFADLAKRCLNLNGRNRPAMTEVRMELERISVLHRARSGNRQEDYEVVDYKRSQESELWDDVPTTFSGLNTRIALSVDSLPLLPNHSW